MKKKQTKRKKTKYPGLDPSVNTRIRHELLDCDYLDKLTEKEKQWLNTFNLEYVSASFNHEKRLHKKKMKTREIKSTGKKKKVDVGKKPSYDANNARNRDMFARAKTAYLLDFGDKSVEKASGTKRSTNLNETENVLIDLIDLKRAKEKA